MFNLTDHIKVPYRIFRNQYLKFRSVFYRTFTNKEFSRFRCNICGKYSYSPPDEIAQRETPSCYHCGSTLRFRSIIATLSKELFGKILTIDEFPDSQHLSGIGMSDNDAYARRLKTKLNYTNTYLHKKPFLDITSPAQELLESADFIISSDVFEHVPPPVSIAFSNLYGLLKKNGLAIISVPFVASGETKEHYPLLYDYQIVNHHGRKTLINITREGLRQEYQNLHFHGGCGDTLEMRIFAREPLLREIKAAGFDDIVIHDTDIPEYGIVHNPAQSPAISMRK